MATRFFWKSTILYRNIFSWIIIFILPIRSFVRSFLLSFISFVVLFGMKSFGHPLRDCSPTVWVSMFAVVLNSIQLKHTHIHTYTHIYKCSIVSHLNQIQASMSSTQKNPTCYPPYFSVLAFFHPLSLSLFSCLYIIIEISSKFNLITKRVYQSPSLHCLYSITDVCKNNFCYCHRKQQKKTTSMFGRSDTDSFWADIMERSTIMLTHVFHPTFAFSHSRSRAPAQNTNCNCNTIWFCGEQIKLYMSWYSIQ